MCITAKHIKFSIKKRNVLYFIFKRVYIYIYMYNTLTSFQFPTPQLHAKSEALISFALQWMHPVPPPV